MTTKNYGPLVSGYLDPDGRNWETTVFQAGKPVLDKELNLQEDLATDTNRLTRVRSSPSGWISEDFLNQASSTSFFAGSVAPNIFGLNVLEAQVNGWKLRITNTNFTTFNTLDLGAGPAGAGAKREDLVILEVWRRLIPPAPASTGKSPAGRIWANGNVKVAVADDLILNFVDDILDGAVGSETTKRVQIQYRLRVIQGVNLFTYPFGMDDPSVVAHSVPPAALTPDGVATLFNYVNQSPNGDPGLWLAGDGNPANALGTVDGYMYAIPLSGVVRRNTTAFDRNTNHNGGVADPGPSDRPDDLFYDVFVDRDLIDLRMGISPDGWNYREVLEKNFNFLLDNVIRTEIGTTAPIGGGVNGNTVLVADDIGISMANGGDGVVTGDTPGATLIGQFDAVLRRFSDRCQSELMILTYSPAGPVWVNNEIVTVSPSALPVYQEGGAFNWAAYAPATITFTELALNAGFFLGSGGASPSALTLVNITGLGQIPQGALSIDIGTVPAGITNEPLFLLFYVAYPSGLGLTKTPTNSFFASLYYNNPLQLPAAAPVLFEADDGFGFDFPHREVIMTYRTVSHTFTVAPISNNRVLVPERILTLISIDINAVPYFGPAVVDSAGITIDFFPTVLLPTDTIDITFKALRPFPQNDEQVTIYYEARMPQTIRDGTLGATTLNVNPLHIPAELQTISVGSGSEDEAYPFPFQYVQPGGVYPTSGGVFSGDHELDGRALISIADFNATTGRLRLPTFVDYTPAPDQVKFDRLPGDVDAEGRSFYKEVPPGQYVPNAHAQELSDPKRHKVLLPFLGELTSDSSIGFNGQIVLVVLSRWALFDEDDSVIFDSNLADNLTTASVYRIKGNLLKRRSI